MSVQFGLRGEERQRPLEGRSPGAALAPAQQLPGEVSQGKEGPPAQNAKSAKSAEEAPLSSEFVSSERQLFTPAEVRALGAQRDPYRGFLAVQNSSLFLSRDFLPEWR